MPLGTYLRQLVSAHSRRTPVAVGFLGLPVLILGTILVQVVRGSAAFTVFWAAEQEVVYSLWLLPLFGFLAWSCNFGAGVLLHSHGEGRTDHLVRTLWWSGIGIEALCLAITVSHL